MDTLLQIYTICSSILVFNLLFLAAGTAVTRSRQKQVINEEDKALNADAAVQAIDEGPVARWRRAHLNALENILPFLPMGFFLITLGPSVALAGTLIGVFTFFRLVHSVCYIKGIQPWRTASFGISTASLAVMVIVILVKVLTA